MKEKYVLIENYCLKFEVVSFVLYNIDVFFIEEDGEKLVFINYLYIINGVIN